MILVKKKKKFNGIKKTILKLIFNGLRLNILKRKGTKP